MNRAAILIILASTARLTAAQTPATDPRDGYAVLERMHTAYAGHWYSNLVFVQRTTVFKPGGDSDTATWYESLKGPNAIRIDLGDPRRGRGVVMTAESTFVFRDGKPARTDADGNPFLPLVMGVYLQPVDSTAKGAERHGFDLHKACVATRDGRRVYIVGTNLPTDSMSPQFWIDAERLVVVGMRVGFKAGDPLDIRVGDYVRVGDAWLGTHVSIGRGGKPLQLEDYLEWSDSVPLPDALFARDHWVTEGHWATTPRTATSWHRRAQ